MPRYAEKTEVGSEKSRAEIERTLTRYGATSFMYGWDQTGALVGFKARGRLIRFKLPLPSRDDFRLSPARRTVRTRQAQDAAYEQAVRQRWRALALVVKAKLEAVEAGISTFEDEFLAWTMLPDGSTASEWMQPQIDDAYVTGRMPAVLPGLDVLALPAP